MRKASESVRRGRRDRLNLLLQTGLKSRILPDRFTDDDLIDYPLNRGMIVSQYCPRGRCRPTRCPPRCWSVPSPPAAGSSRNRQARRPERYQRQPPASRSAQRSARGTKSGGSRGTVILTRGTSTMTISSGCRPTPGDGDGSRCASVSDARNEASVDR